MTSIKALNLPRAVERHLHLARVDTIELLVTKTQHDLALIKGLKPENVQEIERKLNAYLAQNPPSYFLPNFITALNLSKRVYNALVRSGVDTIERLVSMSDEELLAIRNFGERSLTEVRGKLDAYLANHPRIKQSRSNTILSRNSRHLQQLERPSTEEILATLPEQHFIDHLGLPVRIHYTLERWGIHTIEHLILMSEEELLKVPNFGQKSLQEIQERLKSYLNHHSLSQGFMELVDQCKSLRAKQVPHVNQNHRKKKDKTKIPSNCRLSPQSPEPSAEEILTTLQTQQPLKHLGLSIRSYNALKRSGINTIDQLLLMSKEKLLDVRNIGIKSLEDIQNRLELYFNRHPLPKEFADLADQDKLSLVIQLLLETYVEDTSPMPPSFLFEDALRETASFLPVYRISIDRLVLPEHLRNELLIHQVKFIGDLIKQTTDTFQDVKLICDRVRWYIDWLLTQDEMVWKDEIAGQSLSPVYRNALENTSLETFITDWFADLSEREQQIIIGRYGLQGEELTLVQLGQQLDVTRERVRQLQKRAESKLKKSVNFQKIEPLIALIRCLLTEAGGLMNARQLEESLCESLLVGDIDSANVVDLIFALDGRGKYSRDLYRWEDQALPLTEITEIQKQFAILLDEEGVPLSTGQLISRFKNSEFYQNRLGLHNDTLEICLRSHPKLRMKKKQWYLKKRGWLRLAGIILALRQIGEPVHYEIIAERANALLPSNLHRTPHNIHAELGRRPDIFVRVGHGIFGLAEWGLVDDGSVANAAYRVLTEAGKPLHYEVITDRVLETWKVNPESVYAALSVDERFINIGSGIYWIHDQDMPEASKDFGDIFGAKLTQRQKETEHWDNGIEYDTHDEVDLIRNMGTDFFSGK